MQLEQQQKSIPVHQIITTKEKPQNLISLKFCRSSLKKFKQKEISVPKKYIRHFENTTQNNKSPINSMKSFEQPFVAKQYNNYQRRNQQRYAQPKLEHQHGVDFNAGKANQEKKNDEGLKTTENKTLRLDIQKLYIVVSNLKRQISILKQKQRIILQQNIALKEAYEQELHQNSKKQKNLKQQTEKVQEKGKKLCMKFQDQCIHQNNQLLELNKMVESQNQTLIKMRGKIEQYQASLQQNKSEVKEYKRILSKVVQESQKAKQKILNLQKCISIKTRQDQQTNIKFEQKINQIKSQRQQNQVLFMQTIDKLNLQNDRLKKLKQPQQIFRIQNDHNYIIPELQQQIKFLRSQLDRMSLMKIINTKYSQVIDDLNKQILCLKFKVINKNYLNKF